MTEASIVQAAPAHKRPVLIGVLLVALVAVITFRVYFDRNHAHDEFAYADEHEAVEMLSNILVAAPPGTRLKISLQYLNNDSPGMRYAAVDSLENQSGPAIADALERSFLDSSAEVRRRVLDLMPKFDPQRGYRLQLTALEDEDSWVRDHAATLLCSNVEQKKHYVDSSAVPVLIRSLNDPNVAVAPFCISVLRKLTGNTSPEWRYSILATGAVQAKVKAHWADWWARRQAAWPEKQFESLAPLTQTRSDIAPDFTVYNIDGKRLSLEDMRGQVVLLNFWGTWCPPCLAEMPNLARLDDMYRDKGLVIIGVAVKEAGAQSLRDWCQAHNIHYSQVLVADHIAHIYGDCFEVPVSVLIDKRGNIRRRWDGERDYGTFSTAVEKLVKE